MLKIKLNNWVIKFDRIKELSKQNEKLRKQIRIENDLTNQVFKHSDLIKIEDGSIQSSEYMLKFPQEFKKEDVFKAEKEFLSALDKLLFAYKQNILEIVMEKKSLMEDGIIKIKLR